MRSDEQIVRANHGAARFERRTYLPIMQRRLARVFQNLDAAWSCCLRGDTSTPYISSDFVMAEIETSATGTSRSLLSTAS